MNPEPSGQTRPYRLYSFLAPLLLPVYQAVADCLAEQLGSPVELVEGRSYDQVAQADFCFICGLPYILRSPPRAPRRLHALAAPVIRGQRYAGRPIYYSDVVVRRDSPYQTFADLRGSVWAYNEPESQSGYGIVRYHLAQLGETGGYFRQVIEAGFHQRALRLVVEGEADAAAIDAPLLAVALREQPGLAERLRVIAALGPSTIQPFAAAPAVPPSVRRAAQGALADMHRDRRWRHRLAWGLVERFVPVTDQDYDDIRAMLAACERAGFLTVR